MIMSLDILTFDITNLNVGILLCFYRVIGNCMINIYGKLKLTSTQWAVA